VSLAAHNNIVVTALRHGRARKRLGPLLDKLLDIPVKYTMKRVNIFS
jgi:hypothetical protein